MKRIWKPLDIGGLRLYQVLQIFRYKDGHEEIVRHLVLSTAPRIAARIISHIYENSEWLPTISSVDYIGKAVNILMPETWWVNGVPS